MDHVNENLYFMLTIFKNMLFQTDVSNVVNNFYLYLLIDLFSWFYYKYLLLTMKDSIDIF